jgi:hypothetical protein
VLLFWSVLAVAASGAGVAGGLGDVAWLALVGSLFVTICATEAGD